MYDIEKHIRGVPFVSPFSDLFSKAPQGSLHSFTYSPGYCDMDGGSHHTELTKTENGEWNYITSNRSEHSEPMTVSTYAVSEQKVSEFETFIKESKFTALSKRPKSDVFVTDYSPWHFGIDFVSSASGKRSYERYNITEYKKYSDKDRGLMKEVLDRFHALKGALISEVTEND